jgi:hypothetical protein
LVSDVSQICREVDFDQTRVRKRALSNFRIGAAKGQIDAPQRPAAAKCPIIDASQIRPQVHFGQARIREHPLELRKDRMMWCSAKQTELILLDGIGARMRRRKFSIQDVEQMSVRFVAERR